MQVMFMFHGTCDRLTLPEGDRTHDCHPTAGHMIYKTGRGAYWFSIPQRALISFSGMNETTDEDRGTLNLDLVTVSSSLDAKISGGPASGSCTFFNPWKGRAYVRCQAHTKGGDYSAAFTTDGQPPQQIGGD